MSSENRWPRDSPTDSRRGRVATSHLKARSWPKRSNVLASNRELTPLVSEPREEPGVEHKAWLNLKSTEHRATLAKAAIAIANHGGGFIVIGMSDRGDKLLSEPPPTEFPLITQDDVNAAISRFADPAFHCETHIIEHPQTGVQHTVISVPGNVSVPVMAKRDCNGVLAKHRCYIRKPGPRSEEASNRRRMAALTRSVLARKESWTCWMQFGLSCWDKPNRTMKFPGAHDLLEAYCDNSHSRWQRLVEEASRTVPGRGFLLDGMRWGFRLWMRNRQPTVHN